MRYRLSKLAAGSYDVILDGVIVASLVRNSKNSYHSTSSYHRSTAELPVDRPPEQRLPPFTAQEHEFATQEEACRWLGVAMERGAGCAGSQR